MSDGRDLPPPVRGRARGRIRTAPTDDDDAISVVSGLSGLSTLQPSVRGLTASSIASDLQSVSDFVNLSIVGGSGSGTDSESGSGTLLDTTVRSTSSQESVAAVVGASSDGNATRDLETSSAHSSNSESKKGIRVTKNPDFVKIGTGGEVFPVMTNYLHMNKTPDFHLYQHRVDFSPDEDSTLLKKLLVRSQESVIGLYIFDGHMLYTTKPIPMEKRKLEATGKGGGGTEVDFVITIRLVGHVIPESPMYLQFYNMVMRKAMTLIGMEELGRHFYNRHAPIPFKEYQLELWPGIITAIRNHDAGIMLCLEVTHKVLRMASVLDVLNNLKKTTRSPEDFQKAAKDELIGVIVITHYNRRTYRVDEIDFNVTPTSQFRLQDGTVSTYEEYYLSRYNVTLTDKQQPMLVSYPKKRDQNKGITGNIYLIPALCNPTGLTDPMRKNFELMRKLSAHLAMDPKRRKAALDEFIGKIKKTPAAKKEFEDWDIDFIPDFLVAEARKYPPEEIFMGPANSRPIPGDAKGDWTRSLRGRGMLIPENFTDWIMFMPKQGNGFESNLIEQLKIAGRAINVNVTEPINVFPYENANNLSRDIDTQLRRQSERIKFVFIVLPTNSLKTYTEVKRRCILDYGVGCQCLLVKNINRNDPKSKQKLGSICSKIMIQINTKCGGIPWGVKIPVKRMMILGFDVYHCSERKGQSAGALVSTRDDALQEYFSSVAFHADKSELAQNLNAGMQKAIHAYRINNADALPERIILFRDGVGEGQINYVLDYEVPRLKQGIRECYDKAGVPPAKLSVIIVTKKINSRILLAKSIDNVPPGTVVDNTITLPERYDYFLVAQSVNQGTVSPTNYNVVHDEIKWPAERMQRLSYKLCHLYYNWTGTVAVPAPCQYAHKLAYLTGVAINAEAPIELATKLWFL